MADSPRTPSSGGDLFIVDNSISGWTGMRYLSEWCGIAERMDIATGFFEIGSLLELDGKWQGLDSIRILMGAETTARTKHVLVTKSQILTDVKERAEKRLDDSLESDKGDNPFLRGVPAIVEALSSGKIQCRIYNKEKFHAKAYITHARMEVVGAQALVGSSNFTKPGLTQNVELNIQVQSGREVAQLQRWFEDHWNEAEDVTRDVVQVIERHAREYSPFVVYAKALAEFFRGHEMTAGEWEETKSGMFNVLDRYQKEAYWALMKIARQHGGAFLCDGVGLGKTFVGLMLIERLIIHDGKRVVLFAPKGAKEGVWEPLLKKWLPHVGGVGGQSDFSSLAVFSHTDFHRGGDFPDRFDRMRELADAVVIDEAHHFRNRGSRGKGEGDHDTRSRYYRLYDMLDPSERAKTVFMLTATPINNSLTDFRHMAELFTRQDERYFAQTLGVNNLTSYFRDKERVLQKQLDDVELDISENLVEATDFLARDNLFRELVVQRSRSYAVQSQIAEKGESTAFPKREDPKVAEYSIRKTYGELLDRLEKAFKKENPLFSLSIYYPLHYYKGDDESIDPLEEGRQRQVVGLIRTQFLKRFESSVRAFEISCDRLLKKLLAFLEVHSETESERKRLERWKLQNAEVLDYVKKRQFELWEQDNVEEGEDDVVTDEMKADVEVLSREDYKVEEIIQETFLDLHEIVSLLRETRKFEATHDDKLKKLKRLLKSKKLAGQKVIVFSEFADTTRYISSELIKDGIDGVFQVDSATKKRRNHVIEEFAPYYNGLSSPRLEQQDRKEIRVLISTDVLSEGLNLQDATRIINYDIHWNPVRLMQRIGRVDRRMDPEVEKQLNKDHPEIADTRGKILFWNFLPPDELNTLLTLYQRVTRKTLLISETFGIEGKKLLTPDDDYEALREFNHAYEGTRTAIEEMHLEYQALLQENPELEKALASLPGAVFSGRKRLSRGARGVFFCYALPALDREIQDFTEEAGTARWYLYGLDQDSILEEPGEIIESIRSKPNTPRRCQMEEPSLVDIRTTVLKHIKNTYLKRVDAPIGVTPTLKCWMELNGE